MATRVSEGGPALPSPGVQPTPEDPVPAPPTRRRGPLRRGFRFVLRGLVALLGFVALYFGAAEALARIAVNRAADPLAGSIDVYLVSNGVHVDVWVPARSEHRDWSTWLPPEVPVDPDGYVAFGWGDRGFYLEVPTWDDLTVGVALKAVFLPSATAMHVSSYAGRPYPGPSVHLLGVTPEAYRDLCAYVERGFALDSAGRPRLIDHPGYGQNDRFFEGRGSYHLFNTCNVWTNGAVKALGQRAAVWAPFERHARRHLPRNEGHRGK